MTFVSNFSWIGLEVADINIVYVGIWFVFAFLQRPSPTLNFVKAVALKHKISMVETRRNQITELTNSWTSNV